MKRKASLKLSSAVKGPWRAGHSQRKKGQHLEDCNSTTKKGMSMDNQADHHHRMSLLQPRRLDSIYCNCSCSSCQLSLCLLLSLPSHRGFAILSKGLEGLRGSRLYRNNERKCVTVQNLSMQGGVREWIELAFILQTNVQLNLTMFLFLSCLWSYFCFTKRSCEQWLVHKMSYLCGLHYNRYLAI